MTTTSRTLAVSLLTVASLALAAPASADPDYHPDRCAATLERAAHWPGTIPLDGGEYRLVSDAYVSYLAASPACTVRAT